MRLILSDTTYYLIGQVHTIPGSTKYLPSDSGGMENARNCSPWAWFPMLTTFSRVRSLKPDVRVVFWYVHLEPKTI